jgi:hypothetical protein
MLGKWLVILAILALIVRMVVLNLPQLRSRPITCRLPMLAASLLVYCVHLFINAVLWHRLTAANRTSIAFSKALVAWFYSMLGKYIPGKVLLWAGRVYYYKREGCSVKRITFCFAIEMALQLLAAALIVTIVLAGSARSPLQTYRTAFWLLCPLLLATLHPRVLEYSLNVPLGWLKRYRVVVTMRQRDIAGLLGGYLANAFLAGLAFFLFVGAFRPLDASQYLFTTAAFLAAGWIGILSLFAPAGLGVRDGVLLVALRVIIPDAEAAVIVLAARLWTTAGELIAVAVVFFYDRLIRRPPQEAAPTEADQLADAP